MSHYYAILGTVYSSTCTAPFFVFQHFSLKKSVIERKKESGEFLLALNLAIAKIFLLTFYSFLLFLPAKVDD